MASRGFKTSGSRLLAAALLTDRARRISGTRLWSVASPPADQPSPIRIRRSARAVTKIGFRWLLDHFAIIERRFNDSDRYGFARRILILAVARPARIKAVVLM